MSIFREAVEAVEENNKINQGNWSDWNTVTHLLRTYGIEWSDSLVDNTCMCFLESLIRDNGENLDIYKQAMDCIEYGQPFAR